MGTLRVLPLGGAIPSFTLCLWGLGQYESGALRAVGFVPRFNWLNTVSFHQ